MIVADPSLIPGAIEETLRYDPSVPVWRRVTTRRVTVSGFEIPERSRRSPPASQDFGWSGIRS